MPSIDTWVFEKWEEQIDSFIDNDFGVPCTIVYPSRRIPCTECSTRNKLGPNRNSHGGPMPFNFHQCALCGGDGFKEEEATDNIQLRVYYDRRKFRVINGTPIEIPDGMVQVIGYLRDIGKFERANHFILHKNIEGLGTSRYKRDSKWVPHGFKKNRYFICNLIRE